MAAGLYVGQIALREAEEEFNAFLFNGGSSELGELLGGEPD